ncbi:SusC/RagA family TonB-linked outer membrane protein [Pedobacter cryoconitis]|uniref:TonB-linked SusC/RagA family outer membrane protein n=1 Tax=Pedobacter cryoconitis TaxID=188932 RepID=A0A7X0MHH4_9SPHI|nr:SusC/RagA family TonB-linked outer membrane protein [Pedobacter cryoconitis]MBB6499144.1 TonB-linked SusC/RagA family outer membrane protein [Pedobacter cryoconitis]
MKNLIIIAILLVFAVNVVAQHRVTGKVVSVDAQALAGVTIKVAGTKLSVHTDLNGLFTLVVKTGLDTLEFSHLGYRKKQIIVNQSRLYKDLLVKLEPLEQTLEEITIVSSGYQKLSKERATGSFDYISQKTFNQQVGTKVLSRLEAVANGLFVDRATSSTGNLMVRGLSTVTGPKAALIVVDDFPYEGNLDNLNPNDVENITVLKDAAATSIWGARAGNGVIVITTKKGKFNQPLSIDLNVNSTIIAKPDLSYLKPMSIADFINLEEFLYAKGRYTSDINSSRKAGLTPIVELLIRKDKGELSQSAYDAAKADLSTIDVRDQFNKYIYQRGLNQQYALSLKGGSSTHSWILSTGYDRNSSVLDEKYDRFNARLQNTIKPVKNLELTAGIFYTQSKSSSGRPAYGGIRSGSDLYPYARFADDQGRSLAIVKDIRLGYLDTAGRGRLLDWKYYPLEDYKHVVNTLSISDLVMSAGASYRLAKGLSAMIKYQYERQQTGGNNLSDRDSYFARNLVNSFTQLATGKAQVYKVPLGGILDLSNSLLQLHNVRGQLNFSQTWGKHELNAITGGELRNSRMTSDRSRTYGYDDLLMNYGNVDYLTPFPDFKTGVLNYIPNSKSLDETLNRFVSAYANGSYTYNGKYTVSASARSDASNLFGLKANDRWNPLWSAGVSWEASKESFCQLSFLPYLRLRATYGVSGNINPAMSAVTTISYAGGNSISTGLPQASFKNFYNPDLTWERAAMTNLGLDFRTRGNRLTGSLEYFNKRGTRLFGQALIDYTGGTGPTIVKNVAATKGYGFDLVLNSLNVSIANFKWSSNLNASFYQDQVVNYYMPSQDVSSYTNTGFILSGISGKPVYSIFSFKWAGLNPVNGNPRGYANGVISENYKLITGSTAKVEDLKYHGSALPTFYGSLGNQFTYKGISLDVRLTYKLGYYFRKASVNYGNLIASGSGHADYAKRWQHPGDELHTNVPSFSYPDNSARNIFYNGSEVLVDRADHIRLAYVNLAYEVNREKISFLPFKSMSVYVNAANMGLIWAANKDHLDPDYQGLNMIKPSSTFSLGIRANLN